MTYFVPEKSTFEVSIAPEFNGTLKNVNQTIDFSDD